MFFDKIFLEGSNHCLAIVKIIIFRKNLKTPSLALYNSQKIPLKNGKIPSKFFLTTTQRAGERPLHLLTLNYQIFIFIRKGIVELRRSPTKKYETTKEKRETMENWLNKLLMAKNASRKNGRDEMRDDNEWMRTEQSEGRNKARAQYSMKRCWRLWKDFWNFRIGHARQRICNIFQGVMSWISVVRSAKKNYFISHFRT